MRERQLGGNVVFRKSEQSQERGRKSASKPSIQETVPQPKRWAAIILIRLLSLSLSLFFFFDVRSMNENRRCNPSSFSSTCWWFQCTHTHTHTHGILETWMLDLHSFTSSTTKYIQQQQKTYLYSKDCNLNFTKKF